uniref:Uncharacterized protein n=1 Tax=Arundo donax TaxID=35708 RepID=A0A0A8ZQ01_ARUDO
MLCKRWVELYELETLMLPLFKLSLLLFSN